MISEFKFFESGLWTIVLAGVGLGIGVIFNVLLNNISINPSLSKDFSKYAKRVFSYQKIMKLFFCFLKENYKYNFLSSNHLLIPFFTDKSCIGIINNLLWTTIKELFVLSTYQNLIISLLGTSLKFKKNLMLTEQILKHREFQFFFITYNIYNILK